LVEAQVADVGGGGGDRERRAAVRAREVDRRLDQRAADAAAAMLRLNGHVLDFARIRGGGLDELQMSHDLVVRDRDEDLSRVEVRVQLLRGVLARLEQRSQVPARPCVTLDADPLGIGTGVRPL
jgi:hypothetical protein